MELLRAPKHHARPRQLGTQHATTPQNHWGCPKATEGRTLEPFPAWEVSPIEVLPALANALALTVATTAGEKKITRAAIANREAKGTYGLRLSEASREQETHLRHKEMERG